MKTSYRLFMVLLCIPALLSGCMTLDECPDASLYKVPEITLGDAKAKALSVVTVLTADYSSEVASASVEDCGFYYDFNEDFSTEQSISCGKGSDGKFTANVSLKDYGRKFHYKAYISNGRYEIVSDDKSYTLPLFDTHLSISNPTMEKYSDSSATIACEIVADEGVNISERGICYGDSEELDLQSAHVSCGSGAGPFKGEITGVEAGAHFFVRGYAKEGNNIAYGKSVSIVAFAVPAVSTAEVTEITGTTAICGGNVSADNGLPVTERGIVWSTSANPTIALTTRMANGDGTGSFTCQMSDLLPGTLYYVRAYATNSAGTAYGREVSFTTHAVLPTVTTADASSVTPTSATVGGNVTATGGAEVTERGVVWGTSQNPTTSNSKKSVGSGTGSFSTTLTDFTVGTTYYVRAYAVNSVGTSYGDEICFTTGTVAATVTTSSVTSISSTSAVSGGNVTYDGGSAVTSRGIVWSTSSSPTVSLSTKTTDGSGTGSFTSTMTGLAPGTKYYVRAYATNGNGTSYGSELTFTTTAIAPTVTTSPAFSVTSTSATVGGNVTASGGADVTERGVVWSTSQNPTTSNSKKSVGSGTGSFSTTLTDLTVGTTYYVRAYAVNSVGTSYGGEISFTTNAVAPTVTTCSASSVTSSSAIVGGNVTASGGADVIERGVVWNTSHTPTTSNSKKAVGNGTGSFSTTLTGLSGYTTYYVRAYAINSFGTSYGDEISFKTPTDSDTEDVGNNEYTW